MNWNKLVDTAQLEEIDQLSQNKKVVIFKHSTRCSISSTALNRIERKWKSEDEQIAIPYYLDLIVYRDISQATASRYGIEHQSPQVLVISDGKCVFSETHFDINYESLIKAIA